MVLKLQAAAGTAAATLKPKLGNTKTDRWKQKLKM